MLSERFCFSIALYTFSLHVNLNFILKRYKNVVWCYEIQLENCDKILCVLWWKILLNFMWFTLTNWIIYTWNSTNKLFTVSLDKLVYYDIIIAKFKSFTDAKHIISKFIKSFTYFVQYFSNVEFEIYYFICFNIWLAI